MRSTICAMLLTIVVFAPEARAAHFARLRTTPLRASLQRQYDASSRAFERKDLAHAMAPFGPGFTLTEATGRALSRAGAQTTFSTPLAALSGIHWLQRIVKLEGDYQGATVTVFSKLTGAAGARRSRRHYVYKAIWIDRWAPGPAGLQIVHRQMIKTEKDVVRRTASTVRRVTGPSNHVSARRR